MLGLHFTVLVGSRGSLRPRQGLGGRSLAPAPEAVSARGGGAAGWGVGGQGPAPRGRRRRPLPEPRPEAAERTADGADEGRGAAGERPGPPSPERHGGRAASPQLRGRRLTGGAATAASLCPSACGASEPPWGG